MHHHIGLGHSYRIYGLMMMSEYYGVHVYLQNQHNMHQAICMMA